MNRVHLDCPGKINLFLELHGRRADGFHELTTVMVPISLCDRILVTTSRRFSIQTSGAKLTGTNTVEKAYRAVSRRRKIPPVRVDLQKNIPPGSGLGGGSSNAASMIMALDQLFDLDLDRASLAAEVGSDVPFFLHQKPALCTGRGEKIHLLPTPRNINVTLFFPPVEALTAEVYGQVRNGDTPSRNIGEEFLPIWENGSIPALEQKVFNRLEKAAMTRYPLLRSWKKRLGPGTHLTGSGSTFFQLHTDPGQAQSAALKMGGMFVSTLSPFPQLP